MVGERVRPVARNVFCGSPPPLLRKFASHSRLQPRAPSRPANQGELGLTLSRDAARSARSSRQKKEWWLLAWNAAASRPSTTPLMLFYLEQRPLVARHRRDHWSDRWSHQARQNH